MPRSGATWWPAASIKTMAIKNLFVQEAHQQQQGGSAYIDVRSIPEFEMGHPAGAFNIPLLHLDERTRQMLPNAEFVEVVRANFPVETPLLVGCQAGARSVDACQLLASAGYTNLTNVRGGFGGSHDGDPGWVHSALPVETAARPGRSYASLRVTNPGKPHA
jgi:rhodanese-related sulfurtransferase